MSENSKDSKDLVPLQKDELVLPKQLQSQYEQFGVIIRRSTLCPICTHPGHMEINLLRARDHESYDRISKLKYVTIDALETHFKNHFQISSPNRKILAIKEDNSPEAVEIVEKIMEGDFDIFAGAEGVLDNKAKRLLIVTNRIKALSNELEIDNLDPIQTQEFIHQNKLAEDIENSILKTYKLVDKKLFPVRKEELSKAIISFKLNILLKVLNQVQLVLIQFEKEPEYTDLIRNLRAELSVRFNLLEEEVLKSGGTLHSESHVQQPQNNKKEGAEADD